MFRVNWVYNNTIQSAEFATLHAAFIAARALMDGGIQNVNVPNLSDEDQFYMVPRHPEL